MTETITEVKAGRDSLQIMSVVPLPAQCQCFVPVNELICLEVTKLCRQCLSAPKLITESF